MEIPSLNFGKKQTIVPIIQGGMGIGISLSSLAGAVANAGGVGIISGAQVGYREEDFRKNPDNANQRALSKEIKKARSISPEGIIGVNFLTAMNNYGDMVKQAVKDGADVIISGAGLPFDLPKYVKGSNTSIVPIISSAKAAKVIIRKWLRDYDYFPDAFIIEGPEAGGHLGFDRETLLDDEKKEGLLEQALAKVKEIIAPFEQKQGRKIPIIVAGGIFTGKDIADFIKKGADGVQMASRFVATEECDASEEFKQAYINAKPEDAVIVKSPVGLPGRAIRNEFVKAIEKGPVKVKHCYRCLRECVVNKTPYCITDALIDAVDGRLETGLIFAGSQVGRINKMMKVQELIDELVEDMKKAW